MILRPSALYRLSKCAYSGLFKEDESDQSDAAAEGSCAHKVAELILQMRGGEPDLTGERFFDIEVTDEMLEYVRVYTDHVTELTGKRYVELHVTDILGGMQGTTDCVIWDEPNKRVHVIDLKYGYKWVEPYCNLQLVAYAEGLNVPHDWDIKLTIVQPRAYHPHGRIRTWHTHRLGDDYQSVVSEIKDTIVRCQSPNPSAVAGSWCEYCPGCKNCATFDAAVNESLDVVSRTGVNDEYSPEDLAVYYRSIEDAEQMISFKKKVLESLIEQSILNGSQVPGYQTQPTYSRSQWSKDISELKALGRVFGVEMTDEVAITPAQAKKRGLSSDVVKKLTYSAQTGTKIKRVDARLAAQLFSSKEV